MQAVRCLLLDRGRIIIVVLNHKVRPCFIVSFPMNLLDRDPNRFGHNFSIVGRYHRIKEHCLNVSCT